MRSATGTFGDGVARRDDVSAKYTLSGYLTHHVASVFRALVFECLLARRKTKRELPIASTLATATLAARGRLHDHAAALDARLRKAPARFGAGHRVRSFCSRSRALARRIALRTERPGHSPRAFRLLNLVRYPFKRRVLCVGSWPHEVRSSARSHDPMNPRTTSNSSGRRQGNDADVGRPLAPGDEASADTPGAGEAVCRRCAGSG